MGISTTVVGIIPADARYEAMAEVWHKCAELKIAPPDAIRDFFRGERPDPTGTRIDTKALGQACKKYASDSEAGYEVDLRMLPDDIKVLRFTNSW